MDDLEWSPEETLREAASAGIRSVTELLPWLRERGRVSIEDEVAIAQMNYWIGEALSLPFADQGGASADQLVSAEATWGELLSLWGFGAPTDTQPTTDAEFTREYHEGSANRQAWNAEHETSAYYGGVSGDAEFTLESILFPDGVVPPQQVQEEREGAPMDPAPEIEVLVEPAPVLAPLLAGNVLLQRWKKWLGVRDRGIFSEDWVRATTDILVRVSGSEDLKDYILERPEFSELLTYVLDALSLQGTLEKQWRNLMALGAALENLPSDEQGAARNSMYGKKRKPSVEVTQAAPPKRSRTVKKLEVHVELNGVEISGIQRMILAGILSKVSDVESIRTHTRFSRQEIQAKLKGLMEVLKIPVTTSMLPGTQEIQSISESAKAQLSLDKINELHQLWSQFGPSR